MLPANLGLAEAELMLAGKMGRELTLRRALRELRKDYDLILIDCPPSLGLLTVNALVAADHALISTEAEYFSLQGVEQALEVVELAKESLHPDLDWLGAVLNIADMRLVHSREARAAAGALRRQGLRHGDPAQRALRRVGRARRLDRRLRARLGADYLWLAAEVLERLGGFEEPAERVASLRAELVPAPGSRLTGRGVR